jgi:hypothetical protein
MVLTRKLTTALCIASACFGAAVLYSIEQPSRGTGSDAGIGPSPIEFNRASRPDEFLRARTGATSGTASLLRDALLRDAARNQLAAQPGLADPMYLHVVGVLPDDPEVAIAQLVDFQEGLEQALAQAGTVQDFDRGWRVWLATEEAIAKQRKGLFEKIDERLKRHTGPSADQPADGLEGAIAAVEAFQSLTQDLAGCVVALSATQEVTKPVDAPVLRVIERADAAIAKSADAVKAAHEKMKLLRQELGEATSVDKSENNEPGQCEATIRQLGQLMAAVEAADFESWLALRELAASKAESNDGLAGLLAAMDAARSDTAEAQLLAYNLWALGELESAETVDGWDGVLASLDKRLLSPEVSALYSSVYSRRVESVRDPKARVTKVITLLTDSSTPLSAF